MWVEHAVDISYVPEIAALEKSADPTTNKTPQLINDAQETYKLNPWKTLIVTCEVLVN